MDNIDFLKMSLDNVIKEREKDMKELAEDIIKRGIGDRFGWLQSYLRIDARGMLAQRIMNDLDGHSPEAILEGLKDELSRKTGYIVPTNMDAAYQIYELQALQESINQLEWVVNKIGEPKS